MSKTSVITTRIDSDTMAGLDRLAAELDRSRAWLVATAVRSYLEREAAFAEFVQEGEDALDRGDAFTQDEMEHWVRSLERSSDAA